MGILEIVLILVVGLIIFFTLKNRKLLRYLVNTILFIVIWSIPATLFIGWSFSVNGTRPSGLIAIGGIVSIIISYKLVKRINKSQFWLNVFDMSDAENKVNTSDSDSNNDLNFKDNRLILAIIGASVIFLLSIFLFIYGLIEGEYGLSFFFLIPLLVLFFWIREGYFKKDKTIKSSNKEVKEERQVEIKEDKPTNIDALADNLTKLGELKEKGLLTEDEFEEQKKKLLKQ